MCNFFSHVKYLLYGSLICRDSYKEANSTSWVSKLKTLWLCGAFKTMQSSLQHQRRFNQWHQFEGGAFCLLDQWSESIFENKHSFSSSIWLCRNPTLHLYYASFFTIISDLTVTDIFFDKWTRHMRLRQTLKCKGLY